MAVALLVALVALSLYLLPTRRGVRWWDYAPSGLVGLLFAALLTLLTLGVVRWGLW